MCTHKKCPIVQNIISHTHTHTHRFIEYKNLQINVRVLNLKSILTLDVILILSVIKG